MNKFLKLLMVACLYLLEQCDDATKPARERAVDQIDDLRDAAQRGYETAAHRVARASRAIRGDDNYIVGNVLPFVAGIGIGVGVGLILAPASGQETRNAIADKVHDIGER